MLSFELDQNIDEYDWKMLTTTDFWSNSPIDVRHCGTIYYIFGHVQKLTFVVANFLVMFTKFGHIHSVILIRSSV